MYDYLTSYDTISSSAYYLYDSVSSSAVSFSESYVGNTIYGSAYASSLITFSIGMGTLVSSGISLPFLGSFFVTQTIAGAARSFVKDASWHYLGEDHPYISTGIDITFSAIANGGRNFLNAMFMQTETNLQAAIDIAHAALLGLLDGALYSTKGYTDNFGNGKYSEYDNKEDMAVSFSQLYGTHSIEFLQLYLREIQSSPQHSYLKLVAAGFGCLTTNILINHNLPPDTIMRNIDVIKFEDGKYYPKIGLDMDGKKFTIHPDKKSLEVEQDICFNQKEGEKEFNIECTHTKEYHLEYDQCSVKIIIDTKESLEQSISLDAPNNTEGEKDYCDTITPIEYFGSLVNDEASTSPNEMREEL